MFLKVLTAVVSLIVALYLVRQFVMKAERARQRVAAEAGKRRQAGRIATLERDPKTGVYRPRD
jgi:membrane protein implicated in regulation of membrane protease activity